MILQELFYPSLCPPFTDADEYHVFVCELIKLPVHCCSSPVKSLSKLFANSDGMACSGCNSSRLVSCCCQSLSLMAPRSCANATKWLPVNLPCLTSTFKDNT